MTNLSFNNNNIKIILNNIKNSNIISNFKKINIEVYF
jgi:hypothetical protein